uniref:serine protease FAM111A-like n=1 Tax=Semicossyphus pulcher TaxID=241346 RepID=UPI0037E9317B
MGLKDKSVKENEPHETHSFVWCLSDKRPTSFTCNKAGTIEDSLKRSAEFKKLAQKNINKELVIVRDGRAISSHFPCSVIKDDRLTVKYITASDKLKQSNENCAPAIPRRKHPSDQLVLFHVLTNGGENVVRIMRNKQLKKLCDEITVCAYKGEKVKHALKRDGRVLNGIFTKNCALFERGTDIKTEMLNLVDDLDGKTVKIKMINKSPPPETPPESLDDAYEMQSESQRSDSYENQGPPQQSTTESVNDITAKEKPKKIGNITPEEIPDSEKVKCYLSSQVKDLVQRMETPVSQLSTLQNLFHVEYGKNAQTCREVKTMKKLMNLCDSVCQVRINGRPGGSGFLLFDKFVLTNGHVVKNIINESTGQLNEQVTVHFSYESVNQVESGAEVTEVAGFEYGSDASGHKYDWALLSLGAGQELPGHLLKHFGFLPKSGGICIIGHPDGSVKKIDPCLIIPTDNRNEVVGKHYLENPDGVLVEHQGHVQLVTQPFFEHVAQSVQCTGQVLTYESCFYFGSSGSPVFDEHCNVVAMHTGGYKYNNTRGEMHSVIEYGFPLSFILEHIIVQLVERGRFDVLKEYLTCINAQHQHIMTNVKKLVESRNNTAFKNAVNNSVHTEDEHLKMFFEIFSLKVEPVLMDTDSDADNC